MTGTPDWLAQALCRRLAIPASEFVPKPGGTPSARAEAACASCPVGGPDGPCAADRGNDVGLRGDGFVDGSRSARTRQCARCGNAFRANGSGYKLCDWCARAVGTRRGWRSGGAA